MTKKEITISKTIKTPIPGVQFSNQVYSATITYDGEGFDLDKAVKELDEVLKEVQDKDTDEWIRTSSPERKLKKVGEGGE